MKNYNVIIYKDGQLISLCENAPLKLSFKSPFQAIIQLTKKYGGLNASSLTIKMIKA